MPDIHSKYNSRLLKLIARTGNRIRLIFNNGIEQISYVAQYVTIRPGVFTLDKYPLLKEKVEETLSKMHGEINVTLINSIEQGWDLSNEKNNVIVDRRLGGKVPTDAARQVIYDPNLPARNAFISRKEKGLNLSKRVWNLLDPFEKELERGLMIGISEGKPAMEIAKDIQRFLVEPDRLYRKVRDHKGDLRLSKAASEYHPGQGVARNSFSNAMRLARTETNAAYRLSDQERWKNLPFVTGTKIVLSNRHPKYDICDHLNKGIYPKNFVWHGWHPNCLCHQVPVMVTDEKYNELEDFTLGLSNQKPDIEMTKEMPAAFNAYVQKNAERINAWANKPYWVRHNQKFVKELLNK